MLHVSVLWALAAPSPLASISADGPLIKIPNEPGGSKTQLLICKLVRRTSATLFVGDNANKEGKKRKKSPFVQLNTLCPGQQVRCPCHQLWQQQIGGREESRDEKLLKGEIAQSRPSVSNYQMVPSGRTMQMNKPSKCKWDVVYTWGPSASDCVSPTELQPQGDNNEAISLFFPSPLCPRRAPSHHV